MRLLPTEYAVRNLGRSPVRLALQLLGAGLVVLLVMAAAAFLRGIRQSLDRSGEPANVIVLGAGSEESVERSEIRGDAAAQLSAAVRGLRRRAGAEYVSSEIHMAATMRSGRDSPDELQAVCRGVTPAAFLVHSSVRIIEGRAPASGCDELLVGALAHARLGVADAELAVGRSLWFDGRPWRIVGRFEAPGTVMESELWTAVTSLQIAAKRSTVSCVVLTLGAAEFADVDAFCKQRLDLELVAIREADYYAGLNAFFGPIRWMIAVTAGLVSLGGLLGGLNTLYASFAQRVREFATLQTLGFSRRAIVLSLMQESLLAVAAAALAATLLGMLILDRLAVRFSMGAFALQVDAGVTATALSAGLLLAILGVLPPAWRCLRPPITDALRSG